MGLISNRYIKKRFIYVLLILIYLSPLCFAQNKKDSLFLVLKTAKEDTGKVKTLNAIALTLIKENNIDEAQKHALQALELSKKISFKNGIAEAHINLGLIYDYNAQTSPALNEFNEALKIKEELNDISREAYCRISIGNIYNNTGKYPEALKELLTAMKIYEKLDDKKKGMARAHNNIGNVKFYQKDYPAAIKEYQATLKIKDAAGDKKGVAGALNNIGVVYEKQVKYKEALEQYKSALKIRESINDERGISDSRVSMGNIYSMQNLFTEAKNEYLIVLEIQKKVGNKITLANSYLNIGMMYYRLKQYDKAMSEYENALKLSKEEGNKSHISLILANISNLDSATGNYKDALLYYKRYLAYRDSMFNEANIKKLTQAEMQYDFDKKEAITKAEQGKKDAIAQEEQRKQRIITIAITCGLIMVIIFALFVFRSLRITKKQKTIIEQQKDEVLKQKEVVESQKHIIEEKHKEITDSINYAERIQRSFLATKELLDQNLNEYFIFFKPKAVVSGDFYWAAKLSNGNFAYTAADSTGHGVPGAIMSLLNITSLEKATEHYYQPSDILNHTRKTIIERLKKDGSVDGGKDGMDCSLVVIDKNKMQCSYAAANNPVWLVRNTSGTPELLEFAPDKMPLSKHDKDQIPFSQKNIDLKTGDIIYTFTDGIADQFGGIKGKKFMYKQLKTLLISVAHLPMGEQKNSISTAFADWKGDLEQIDDVCLMAVKI